MTTTAYSYCRFSSERQRKGDSIRRQIEAARVYAKAQGWTLDDSLRDEGVSAFKGKNAATGALKRFLDRIEDGTVKPKSRLLVESLDRLSRNDVTDALQLFIGIIKSGIEVITLADGK